MTERDRYDSDVEVDTSTPEYQAKKKQFEEGAKRINAKLDESAKALDEAIDISEETGVPFTANMFGAHNTYVPETFEKEKGPLTPDDIEDLTDFWGYEDSEMTGWQTSFC